MPERPGRVTIALDHGDVTMSSLGRQVLLGRLHVNDSEPRQASL